MRPATNHEGESADNGLSGISVVKIIENNKNHENKRHIFHQINLDVFPRLSFYRRSTSQKRPSIGQLYGDDYQKEPDDVGLHAIEDKESSDIDAPKLGWIEGVLVPCLLNTWGVMLFLRLSWVVAQAGVVQSQLIILVSAIVCVLTTLSLSAITTNGEVKGGGLYFIISRSLGAEFGASVGLIFAFANTVAASMNTIGFCDSLNDLLGKHDLKIIDGGVNDVRLVGTIAIIIMILICCAGMDWESKAQNFLLVIIVVAMADYFIGATLGPSDKLQIVEGFTGFKAKTFLDNLWPDYRVTDGRANDFFSVFAIFFPCVTGLQAGANISGDLKNPNSAIPKGTLLSLLISMTSYALVAFFAGFTALRDASGNISEYVNGQYTDCKGRHCDYGLHNSYYVMQLGSLSGGSLIYAGCFAATLSTALTNLLSVPRLIQALGNDRIYPGLIFFSKKYGKYGEPLRGYVIVFIASTAFLLIANLDIIAPLISNFYLASYALVNYCTFHAALIQPLGWRPTFRFYNKWLSLIGFLLCSAIMLLINVVTTILTVLLFFVLYYIVVRRKPEANWGSSVQAQTFKNALHSLSKLNDIGDHVKNYRPQILLFSGQPLARPSLVELANLITLKNGLLFLSDISQRNLNYKERSSCVEQTNAWLRSKNIEGFFSMVESGTYETAAKNIMQASGVGKLRPNIIMIGYKNDWLICSHDDLLTYFNILQFAFENRYGVTILRLPLPLNICSSLPMLSEESVDSTAVKVFTVSRNNTLNDMLPINSDLDLPGNGALSTGPVIDPVEKITFKLITEERASIFERKQKGTIDIWWLYDDGGLTVLLPYILSKRKVWSKCHLRLFALTNHQQDIATEERNLTDLLSKFRIKFSSVKILSELNKEPETSTITYFNSLVNNFRNPGKVNVADLELSLLSEKSKRIMRTHDYLQENSKEAALVVMSLPVPRKGVISAPLYMTWLELLSCNMPPFLFIRGNQTDVLTFYS